MEVVDIPLKVPTAHREEALRAYVAGEPLMEIAERLGISTSSLSAWANEAGLNRRATQQLILPPGIRERYLAGESVRALRMELGTTACKLKTALRAAGVTLRTRPHRAPPDSAEVARLYREGYGVQSIRKRLDVTGEAVKAALVHEGVTLRSRETAMRASWRVASPESRARRIQNSGDGTRACREEASEKMALSKQRTGHLSWKEVALREMLLARGLETVPQLAIGPYNVDLAAAPVAVEAMGWQLGLNGRFIERAKDLLRRSWWVVVVRIPPDGLIPDSAADHVISLTERARRDPSARCEYRVIGRQGQLLPIEETQDYHLT